jgi:lipid-A-disaccharide synthase
MTRAPVILLTAVEASGDALGAGLMRELRRRLGPDVRFIGVGGAAMAAEGLVSAFDVAELSIMGFVEGLLAARRADRRAAQVAALAERERPDVAVLIDSWGFSYLLAKRLRRALPTLPLVKYVAPQVWATRPGRARTLARTFDRLISILAFDAPYFEREGVPVTVVSHPALAMDFSGADPQRLRAHIGAGAEDPILLVLPGSRPSEIARLMAPFEDAIHRLKAERPALHVVVPVAGSVAEAVKAKVSAWPFRAHVVEDEQGKLDAMAGATVALACSGTVTTELAMAGCPMVVAYRVAPLTAVIARMIILTRYVTLFNIAAGKAVAPEFIQEDCTGPKLAAALAARLDDPQARARQVAEQFAALDKLGRGGPEPSIGAAEAVIEVLAERARPAS